MKLCFSTYSKILLYCSKHHTNQHQLIEQLVTTVDKSQAACILSESTASSYANGDKNISPSTTKQVITFNVDDIKRITRDFEKNVIPLINQNKIKLIVLAMKDLVSKDNEIEDDTIIEYASHLSKSQLLAQDEVTISAFLVGILLYILDNTKNKGTSEYAKAIDDNYFDSLKNNKSTIKILSDSNITKSQALNMEEITTSDDSLEKARLFCIEHEDKISLLPICEIASLLNPKHQFISPVINDFNKQPRTIQRAILTSESLLPYEHCTWENITKCINAFNAEIIEKGYSTTSFLYDSAKYFHYADEKYAEYMLKNINPYIFKRKYGSELTSNVPCSLRSCIEDFDFGLINHPEEENEPPFDALWSILKLSTCDEKALVFWVNRFIITVCHYLHGYEYTSEYDEKWKYKDTVDENIISSMEEMYYYALFLLYKSYGEE